MSLRNPRPGDEPSTARPARPNHTYHGDLASQTRDKWGDYHALWKVRLRRVTQVSVRWSQRAGGRIQLNVLPNVTDRSWPNEEPLLSSNTGRHLHASFVFIAAISGWYYLDFWSERPGRYTFSLGRVTPAHLG